MTTKRETRVSDVQRWWEYEYGYEWKFYQSDDERPTDVERCDQLISDLVVRDDEPSDGAKRGTAVHAMLESIAVEAPDQLEIDMLRDHDDALCIVVRRHHDLVLPPCVKVEQRQQKRYGDVLVSGTVDVLAPSQVIDWKTSAYAFKYDAYYRSLQWRFYLDMTGRDHFRYIGLQIRDPFKGTDEHRLTNIDELDCYAYAGMTDELTDKVERFADFVDRECPEYWNIDIYGKD